MAQHFCRLPEQLLGYLTFFFEKQKFLGQFKYSLICQVLFLVGDVWSVVEERMETG
jgi:hypothetical protein